MTGTAIIGLGAMGFGMARNIMAAGIALKGFDISEAARSCFAGAGGTATRTAAEAARDCDLLLLMVLNAEQAQQALFASGAAAALAPGATVVVSSTVAPSEVCSLAADLSEMGLHTIDAPVSGGQVGADAGALTVMASGPPEGFERAAPVLEAISKTVHRLGDAPGLGATYKVVHQLAAGVHLAVAGELMALGAKAGCDPEKLFEIVSSSAGQSWMMDDRVPRMMDPEAPCKSAVDIFIKDLGLVLQTGRAAGVPLPLSAAAFQMFLGASAIGHGAEDDSRILRAYEALSGTRPPNDDA